MKSYRFLYHIVALLVASIWGSTFISTKLLLLAGMTAAQIFVLRFAIAYVLLLVYSIYKRGRLFAASWRHELLMMALGVVGGSLYFLTENSAMNYTTTTNTSIIVSLCPLFASALIGAVYKSQRLNRVQTLGTVMAAAGVVVVVMNGRFVLHLSPLGDALAFMACLCWAVYSLLMIPATKRYNTLFITRKVFFYGLVTIIPYYMLVPEETWIFTSSILQFFNFSILLNLLFLGVVASMLCFLAWTWVIKRLGAMVTTNYVYLNPVATIVFAWWILNEQITSYFLLGTVLILLGMYLADKKKA